ncbi:hypothetical protein M3599_23420 [Niallia circulans]|uniref:hypothetical protein n=1 Tax=Niallia circulans TaxID=1397 RepID=UPI00203D0B2D|nr:hypothetical protein [Niallia circulans]MCM2983848.1 hypothetical protein [Niallia circulans]
MDRKELGRRIAERVRNMDNEAAQKTISDIIIYISDFYSRDIALEGHYKEVELSHSGYMCILRVFDTTLKFNLNDDNKIKVTKEVNNQVTKIDEIIIENGKAHTEQGEFSVEIIDKYLIECFKNVF